ncbi:MAG TPA: DinB family protein [Cyclobacteriaceae bacterium]
MNKLPEVWLRGSLANIPSLLQPVAHALLQAREEINELMTDFPDRLLWERPAGVAAPAFHLQHLTGVMDRLFTYAAGNALSEKQFEIFSMEGKPDASITTAYLVKAFNKQVDIALDQLRSTSESILTEQREVGRAKLPSTMIGLYVHAAEHTMRHVGQLLVTVRVLKDR